MAAIYKRKSKYAVVYSYKDENGNKKQKWETYGTKAEAQKRKAQIEYERSLNTFVPPTVKTISELLQEYFDIYGVGKWAPSTYAGRRSLVDNYINPYIGSINLSDVTPRLMEGYYQKLLTVKAVIRSNHRDKGDLVSPRLVREIHKVLSCAFNQAVKWEYMARNPVQNATLPKHETQKRAIWTADEFFRAVELCENDNLELCMQLAFACSLRIGEITGLTWDCVDVSEEAIEANNAWIYVEKELSRVPKDIMQLLDNRDIKFVFPAIMGSKNVTSLVLKTPKTKSSVRKIWLPTTVAKLLVKTKKAQDELKEEFGGEYWDYDLVVAQPNGRSIEERLVAKAFKELIDENNLPHVVFHSLRHTSTTYKLKLSGGDIKSVQGDTGHAQGKMVTEVYSHIIDEDRRNNAVLFEKMFYDGSAAGQTATDARRPELSDPKPSADVNALASIIAQSPELVKQLAASLLEQMVRANL